MSLDDGTSVRPDFFIIGAPKSGTTAMCEYLRGHPHVCLSEPKEPHHFATDLLGFCPGLTDEEYLRRYFSHCSKESGAVGDGSVFHLFSRVAVENILDFEPDARFIVMVRNPVDVAHAFHRQLLYNYSEDVKDFESAWRMQDRRRSGERIPDTCREPRLLQYREVAALGSQLERLLTRVPADQVHVVLFDDFVEETRSTYEEALRFLGLAYDGRTEFPRVNPSHEHTLWWLARWTQRPPRWLVRWGQRVKGWVGIERWGIVRKLRRLNKRTRERAPLRPEFHARLVEDFRLEVEKLESILDRDLSDWRTVPR